LVELLHHCSAHRIPTLVVSAGISNLIEHFLEGLGAPLGHVRVSANRMHFQDGADDESGGGKLNRWAPERPCHSHNKALTYQRERAFFEQGHVAGPEALAPGAAAAGAASVAHAYLVMGDKPYDGWVLGQVPPSAVAVELRVGFFGGEGRYTLDDYREVYDVVLPLHGSLELALLLFEK
jgi:hypothetical protein